MKTKSFLLTAIVLFVFVVSFALNAVTALAEEDYKFKTSMEFEGENTELKVGDSFYVKISVTDITSKTGLIGLNLRVDYDPSYLSVEYENSETSGEESDVDAVTFGSINLPSEWTGDAEKIQNIVRDENNKEIGTAVIMCLADLSAEDLAEQAYKSDEFFVLIPFKCIAPCQSTTIKIDTDEDLAGTELVVVTSSFSIEDVAGQGSELVINNIQGTEESKTESTPGEKNEDGNNSLVYILIAAGAVVIIGVVVAVIVSKKKK
ncbi:MAG: hypothetical protein GX148_06745 [Clostridiales bacterium]|nr:hypothetical protein [Clostridiales bacterium]